MQSLAHRESLTLHFEITLLLEGPIAVQQPSILQLGQWDLYLRPGIFYTILYSDYSLISNQAFLSERESLGQETHLLQ